MIITQRGVLPPVNFAELDASLQGSLLSPAGARLIVVADLDPALYTTGVFAPAWTGFSTAPVGNLSWVKFNGIVWLINNTGAALTGTSNATTMTITNLPAAITPSINRSAACLLEDNAGPLWGTLDITTAGVIAFSVFNTTALANRLTQQSAGWTAASTKGFRNGAGVVYLL